MPIYTFKCPSCNKCLEASCGVHVVKMKRVWKKTGKPQFKGSGFYETDYKNKSK
jgi:predicted nucleic acid-binding Zn ribbon protein